MRKLLFGIVATSSLVFAGNAYAVCSNAAGAIGGAAAGATAGAVVGGPVGAAIGGVAGGAIGSQALPPTACSYVVEQDIEGVTFEGAVVVGEPLPAAIVLHEIPDTKTYVFAEVNSQRVIVDPESRVVVEVLN
jgi:hypothetical protein